MALATFYHPALEQSDKNVVLSVAESAHATKSRRLRQGSAIQLINGRGLLAQAHILQNSKDGVSTQIDSIEKRVSPPKISIATAIPKGDRQRTMIDMLTQLGVSEIIPLRCERSITKYKSTIQEKWQRVAIEACKQSSNPWLPKISVERDIQKVLCQSDGLAIYADASGSPMTIVKTNLSDKLTIIIGPEGGFSKQEISLLNESCSAVNLGLNILRTELACVIAASHARHIIDIL